MLLREEIDEIFRDAQALPARLVSLPLVERIDRSVSLPLSVREARRMEAQRIRVETRRLYKREWMRAQRAGRPRKELHRCRRCGEVGHNKRSCTGPMMPEDPEQFIRHVADLLHRHRHTSGTGFTARWQPKSALVEEHTIIAIRRDDEEGGHLAGLLELSEFDVRVTYAFKTYRGLIAAVAARLKERFR